MTSTWVLMTALPPTQGHLNLIRFAASVRNLAEDTQVRVLVCTQPDEPYCSERVEAINDAIDLDLRPRVEILHHSTRVQQVPDGDDDHDFWAMWTQILRDHGLEAGDVLVASEGYGVELSRSSGTRFIPYDMGRTVHDGDATRVRADPLGQFGQMLGTFARLLTKRVTFFGAESTGKTTLSRAASESLDSYLLPEWARPYLETVGPQVTDAAMHDIWCGQRALQESTERLAPRPFILQDTDLFSTLGYWEMYDPDRVPPSLVGDALATRSDLYLVCPSDIPFEADPLRYGGTQRESTDRYWIDLLERFDLPHVVLSSADLEAKLQQASELIIDLFDHQALAYDRIT